MFFLTASRLPAPASRFSAPQAGNGTRTRDPNLGKVVLYQLSYSRNERKLVRAGNRDKRVGCEEGAPSTSDDAPP